MLSSQPQAFAPTRSFAARPSAIVSALALGGYWLRKWIVPEFSGSLARLADVTIATALLVVTLEFLGAFSVLRLGWIILACILVGLAVYWRKKLDLAAKVEQPILARGWYYDSSIAAFMGGPGRKAFDAIAWFDKHVVDGAVNGVAAVVGKGADRGRLVQTGYVRNYALGLTFGVILLAGLFLTKAVF